MGGYAVHTIKYFHKFSIFNFQFSIFNSFNGNGKEEPWFRFNPSNSGAILITTLWTLIILAIFAVSLARNAFQSIRAADYFKKKVTSHYLARAGVKRAAYTLVSDEIPEYDALNESWANSVEDFKEVSLGMGSYTVSYKGNEEPTEIRYGIVDEESRINVNRAPWEVLSRLIQLTADSGLSEADGIAQSIVDWRDSDNEAMEAGAEDSYYEGLSPPYPCKNDVIESIEELLLIKGMTYEILEKIRDYITIFGSGTININTVGGVVLEAIGMDTALALKISTFRMGNDGIAGTEDDNIFMNASSIVSNLEKVVELSGEERGLLNSLISRLSTQSGYFRIFSQGYLSQDDPRRSIEAVVERGEESAITIVSWHED